MLNERFSAEFFYHAALEVVFYEGIVLLGGTFGQRLKPVGDVGHTKLLCPFLHATCNLIGYRLLESGAVFYCITKLVVGLQRKILKHLLLVEHILAVILRRAFSWCFHFNGLFLEGLFNYIES